MQAEGPGVKEQTASMPTTIHQGDDIEGPLDIWTVVKPGNTKEKIAFFAAQQCRENRVFTMKNKSTWDIDGRSTKRRKKSLDLKKAKIHLERMQEASRRCNQPEPFACGIEHCSVHNVNEGGDGGSPNRPLSVIEMVAFLEQRASVLLTDCTKNCPSASVVTRFPSQSKAAIPASNPFPSLVSYEAHYDKAAGDAGSDGEQAEPVRVLDMVARLESECLRRQSEREAGGLSRNNSFRRNVGRVLLVSGTPPESEAGQASSGMLNPEERGDDGDGWRSRHSSSVEDGLWEGSSADTRKDNTDSNLDQGVSTMSDRWCNSRTTAKQRCTTYPDAPPTAPPSLQSERMTVGWFPQEPEFGPHLNLNLSAKESLSISVSVTKTKKAYCTAQPPSVSFGEESLPGRLFLLLCESETCQEHEASREASTEGLQAGTQRKDAPTASKPCILGEVSALQESPAAEGALEALSNSGLTRQRSHDFLETRFKIQQLLEPQQYLVFLPHHILVKIFGLLPTRSLVAIKCTCGYFKFILEYYNVRPADSRWVRDPRYREDPCKQCKKKYVRGDVSLCRWHPKPYCQALPYGPGYWMCCHRSQKSVPGCKLGLHDNHWVPACHSFNRAIHKKSREKDENC